MQGIVFAEPGRPVLWCAGPAPGGDMTGTDFSAFPSATFDFLRGIADNNGKEWFEANRAALRGRLCRAGAALRGSDRAPGSSRSRLPSATRPRINGSISRINRDVRFSQRQAAIQGPSRHLVLAWREEGLGPARLLSADHAGKGVSLAAACMGCRARCSIAFATRCRRTARARRCEAAIGRVKAAGPYEVGGATRKTVPRGFDASHKRARFLLHEGLYAGLELPGESQPPSPVSATSRFGHFSATWPIG